MRIRLVCYLMPVIFGLFLAGCNRTPPPSAEDTIMDNRTGDRADWVDTTAVYGEGAEGLQLRSDSSLDLNAGAENIIARVYFDFDQSGIRPSERVKVNEAAETLFARPDSRLLIEGHCDWRGTTDYNLALGDRRANSVKRFLVSLGVQPERIETSSRGDLEAAENASSAEMQEDRRADLMLLQ